MGGWAEKRLSLSGGGLRRAGPGSSALLSLVQAARNLEELVVRFRLGVRQKATLAGWMPGGRLEEEVEEEEDDDDDDEDDSCSADVSPMLDTGTWQHRFRALSSSG